MLVLLLVLASDIGMWTLFASAGPMSHRGPSAAGANPVAVPDPGDWLGEHFPLLRYIDIADTISQGEWRIVLYRHDCRQCQTFIHSLLEPALHAEATRLALIELPPYGGHPDQLEGGAGSTIFGRLSPDKEWFMVTPLVVSLNDARVTETIWP